ncbi:MAG: hypothetical protein WC900_04490, partial [Oscillospiraceae bacterium]
TLMSVIILTSSVFVFRINDSVKLKIVLLSQGSSTAAVIYKGSAAAIVDLEGKGKISSSVEKLLTSKGIKTVGLLVLNDNPLSNISVYIEKISLPVENISTSDNTVIEVFGQSTAALSSGDTAAFLGCEISFLSDGGYQISYDNFKLLISKSSNDFLSEASVCVFYGNGNKSIHIQDRIIIFDDNTNGKAFLITAEKNGENTLRRLDYALRE